MKRHRIIIPPNRNREGIGQGRASSLDFSGPFRSGAKTRPAARKIFWMPQWETLGVVFGIGVLGLMSIGVCICVFFPNPESSGLENIGLSKPAVSAAQPIEEE